MLRFRLLGIPVGVHVTFLLILVLGPRDSALSAALWVAAAFVAIILHEFGHALTARAFGGENISVTLYGLGGLTSFTHGRAMSHGRSFLISGAGSAVGIVAGLALVGLGRLNVFDSWPDAPVEFLEYFVFVALVWGVLNWIPIVPLDGGHMSEHFIAIFNEAKAPFIAQIVTWVTVGIVVPVAIKYGYTFGAAMIGFFAFIGYRDYKQRSQPPASEEDPRPAPPASPTPQDPPPPFPI
jgi:stage IV sporulation protein FB